MKAIFFATLGLALLTQAAAAATWSAIGFSTQPQDAASVAAAADALMSSAAGKEFKGRLFLQAVIADGDDPATHSFVPVYATAADREAFVAKLQGDAAWAQFQETLAKLTVPVSTVMYRTQKRWGKISDDDVIWRTHSFDVSDPAAFAAALDTFLNSETGKKFPGQVFLSSVISGGLSPVSHVVSVGQVSEAAIEAWEVQMQGNTDWIAYLEASQASSVYLGNSLVRTIKTWGATLDEVTSY